MFKKLESLVLSGANISLHLRTHDAAKGHIQLDVIIETKQDGDFGRSIPPKAFIATCEELDQSVDAIFAAYLAPALSLHQQIEASAKDIEAATAAAQEAAKKASKMPKLNARAGTKTANSAQALDENEDPNPDDDNDPVPSQGNTSPGGASNPFSSVFGSS